MTRPFLYLLAVISAVLVAPVPTASARDYSKLFEETDPAVVLLYYVEGASTQQKRGPGHAGPSKGLGSGILIDDQGHILTAAHVVQTADQILAEFANGFRTRARVIASNPDKDVSLLQLEKIPDGIKPAKIGDSDKAKVGEEVYVIGAPFGLAHTLTIGHISARHKKSDPLTGRVPAELFQTDAAVNQGNSGGPLFNIEGEVIGVVSFIKSPSGASAGLGFAVTSNAAMKALFDDRAPWTGMSGVMLAGPTARALNVPQAMGLLVQKVAAGSPAALAGLRPSIIPVRLGNREFMMGGDIILALDGIEMSPTMLQAFWKLREDLGTSTPVRIKVLRGGRIVELSASLPR